MFYSMPLKSGLIKRGHGWTSMRGLVTFWYRLRRSSTGTVGEVLFKLYGQKCEKCGVKSMSGHQMQITPSRWQYNKFKDYLHFYFMLGIIPCTLISVFVNVFVGPAELAEIPEGYVPKHWEYHRHPITRWMARYVFPSPQQIYENNLHAGYEVEYTRQLNLLEKEVLNKMAERGDYQSYYYLPVSARHHELIREETSATLKGAHEVGQ
nr:EOG090X0FIE [Lepidurus arcticus]